MNVEIESDLKEHCKRDYKSRLNQICNDWGLPKPHEMHEMNWQCLQGHHLIVIKKFHFSDEHIMGIIKLTSPDVELILIEINSSIITL